MFKDIEIFSTLDCDVPTGGSRSFASNMGELVLVTEYPVQDIDKNLVLEKLLRGVEPLDGTVNFEFRGAAIEESGELKNVILFPEGGFLSSLIHSDVNLGWYFRIKVAVDICRGLLFLHDAERVHNDLRPANLGLDSEWRCKFLELACIETVPDLYTPYPLTPGIRGDGQYLAPEVLKNSACTASSDMYSFGLVLFELCARVHIHAFPRNSVTMTLPIEELLESLSDGTPSSLIELIRQLLNDEAEYRPSVEDAFDWLESLMMETSPQDDPPDPPLPPLPFLQRRQSSRPSGQVSPRGGRSGECFAISPNNAQRLRDIAAKTRSTESEGLGNGRNGSGNSAAGSGDGVSKEHVSPQLSLAVEGDDVAPLQTSRSSQIMFGKGWCLNGSLHYNVWYYTVLILHLVW